MPTENWIDTCALVDSSRLLATSPTLRGLLRGLLSCRRSRAAMAAGPGRAPPLTLTGALYGELHAMAW